MVFGMFGDQIAISYQIFKSGSSKKVLNVLNLQGCVDSNLVDRDGLTTNAKLRAR